MKKLLFGILPMALCSCESRPPYGACTVKSVHASLLIDVTDENLPVDAVPILRLLDCANSGAKAEFRLSAIDDKLHTPIYTAAIEDAAESERANERNDPQYRDMRILDFYRNIRKEIATFYSSIDTTQSLKNSECIRRIFGEINALKAQQCDKTYLIIFSDLMEKADLDFYQSFPSQKTFEAYLEKEHLLPPSLDSVTFIFVYNPPSRKASLQYEKALALYRSVIEARNGKVVVEAQSKIFHV